MSVCNYVDWELWEQNCSTFIFVTRKSIYQYLIFHKNIPILLIFENIFCRLSKSKTVKFHMKKLTRYLLLDTKVESYLVFSNKQRKERDGQSMFYKRITGIVCVSFSIEIINKLPSKEIWIKNPLQKATFAKIPRFLKLFPFTIIFPSSYVLLYLWIQLYVCQKEFRDVCVFMLDCPLSLPKLREGP